MIKPLGNRILVNVIIPTYEGLLTIPEDSHVELLSGEVLAKGSKVGDKLQIGDVVVFEKCYGREVTKEDKQRVLDVGCLLAVKELA